MLSITQERLELYGNRVKKAAYDTELASSRRSLAIDVAAANRFIDAAMALDLSKDQRLALQQVSAVDWQGAEGMYRLLLEFCLFR